MGDILGGIFGGVGSIAGAVIQSQAADKARQDALTGYNYLSNSPYNATAIQGGINASNAQQELLGLRPLTPGTTSAFDNYLKSTGYDFQMKQGQNAITTSNAAKGLLNSGGTLKALNEFGQGVASQSFNNYLGNLGNVQTAGSNAVTGIGNAGSGAGTNAGNFTAAGGDAVSNGVTGAIGGFGGALSNALSRGNTNPLAGTVLGGSGPQG